MSDKILKLIKQFIPKKIFKRLSPIYHYIVVFLSALVCRFPSNKIFVVGVTGTKGKTSVVEIANSILEEAGFKTAIISTLRFKIDKKTCRNQLKMTMPGRFFIQKFLRKAVNRKCQYVLMEMTSQGVSQFRHKFINIDTMIFTNLSPEHIESHGSFEKYREAKMALFSALEKSKKAKKTAIINNDDENASYFSGFNVDEEYFYGIEYKGVPDANKIIVDNYDLQDNGMSFSVEGVDVRSGLLGKFNLYNILAAISFSRSRNIGWGIIKRAISKFRGISGRMEVVEGASGLKVVVDYAHTAESLEGVYDFFKNQRKICILGSAGGGRDKWKRPEMGAVAAKYCDEIILTNEDPYDEKPMAIIKDIASGIKSPCKYKIVPNRREAIKEGLKTAKKGDVVIITGKGTDPYIMGPNGSKIEWDDKTVVLEELGLRD